LILIDFFILSGQIVIIIHQMMREVFHASCFVW